MIAVTDLSSYLYCPRKVFITKVLKIRPPLKDVLVLGSINHEVIDITNKLEENIITSILSPMSEYELLNIYKMVYHTNLKKKIAEKENELKQFNLDPEKTFESIWPKMLNEAKLRSGNVFKFISFNQVFGAELWEKLSPKYITELSITSQKIGLRGIIDKVEVHDNTKFIPFELKTGSMPRFGVWPGHSIQILSYVFLLREKLNNPDINEGIVYYLDQNEKRKVIANPFSESELLKLVSDVTTMIESKTQPAILENKNKCNSCNLKEVCYKL
jgi:CRISPR-associated protein Cas4